MKNTRVTVRTFARIVGQIISTGPATGNLARIISRHCQMFIACANDWGTFSDLAEYCLHELKFWYRKYQIGQL